MFAAVHESGCGPKRRKTISALMSALGVLSGLVLLDPSLTGCDPQRTSCQTSGVHAPTGRLTRAAQSFKFHQSINSNPLVISIATAVLPCTPNATVLLPPWCNTITASAIGMRVAASMNQPRTCADP